MKFLTLLTLSTLLFSCNGKKNKSGEQVTIYLPEEREQSKSKVEEHNDKRKDTDHDGVADVLELERGSSPYVADIPSVDVDLIEDLHIQVKNLKFKLFQSKRAVMEPSKWNVVKNDLVRDKLLRANKLISNQLFPEDNDLVKLNDMLAIELGCFGITDQFKFKNHLQAINSLNIDIRNIKLSNSSHSLLELEGLDLKFKFVNNTFNTIEAEDNSGRVEFFDVEQFSKRFQESQTCLLAYLDNGKIQKIEAEYSDIIRKIEAENAHIIISTDKQTNYISVAPSKFKNLKEALSTNDVLLRLNKLGEVDTLASRTLGINSSLSVSDGRTWIFHSSNDAAILDGLSGGEYYYLTLASAEELNRSQLMDEELSLNYNQVSEVQLDNIKAGDRLTIEVRGQWNINAEKSSKKISGWRPHGSILNGSYRLEEIPNGCTRVDDIYSKNLRNWNSLNPQNLRAQENFKLKIKKRSLAPNYLDSSVLKYHLVVKTQDLDGDSLLLSLPAVGKKTLSVKREIKSIPVDKVYRCITGFEHEKPEYYTKEYKRNLRYNFKITQQEIID